MGEVVELNRKMDALSVHETLARVERAGFDHIVVVGVHDELKTIHIWTSGEDDVKDHWLASKAAACILETS